VRFKLWGEHAVPEPNRSGWSRLSGSLRARVAGCGRSPARMRTR
jgi:hypothetical protein